MPVAKITGQGLIAIGCSVALLWTCLLVEQITLLRAARAMEQLQKTSHHSPVPGARRRSPVMMG